ncbi:MAG: hypothetical protein NVS9B12_09370 [Vulcanimicrobiaceae bacterium]
MQKNKVESVYALREAAEEHGRVETLAEADRSAENLDRLLEAKEQLERKTIEAIEACEQCGQSHCTDDSHKKTNVINVRFAKNEDDATG